MNFIAVLPILGSSGLALLFLPSTMQVMCVWKRPRSSSIRGRSLEPVCALDYLPFHGLFYGSYSFRFGLSEHRGLLPSILQASCSVPLRTHGFELLSLMCSDDIQEYLPLHESYGCLLYYIFNTMLLTLLVFHVYWWFLICSMISRQLKNQGQVGEDIRSGKLVNHHHRHQFDWRPLHFGDPVKSVLIELEILLSETEKAFRKCPACSMLVLAC